jgi:hypothetical protein
MKRIIVVSVIIAVCLIPSVPVISQTNSASGDKYTLLTMPYINRPLTLYKGQLQVNTGYKFAVRSRSFNNTGDVIVLKDKGNSSVLHYYFIELKYGLTGFIEFGAETNYMRRGIRSESTTYLSTNATGKTDEISVNDLKEFRGMSDLFLYTTLRLPFDYKWFDLGIRGGLFLPTSRSEPLEPTHTIVTATTANSYTINYHFNNKNGFGVPVYCVSAAMKLTLSKFALEADFTLREPIKEGTNIRWEQTLLNKTFSYYNKPYQYLLDRTTMVNLSVHYQATGWFNIYLNSSSFQTSEGWTEYLGNKYKNPEMQLFTLEPGFEIQISPSLTIYQIAGLPLSGKNSDAPFYLFTTVSFNIFPFLR